MLLTGCAGPTGPVFGDWRGADTTGFAHDLPELEIILDGAPDATDGVYHLVRTSHDPFDHSEPFAGADGRWTSTVIVDHGRRLMLVHLEGVPYGHVDHYALLADGSLVPVIDPAHPDLSATSHRYALAPVPKTAFGYGRP